MKRILTIILFFCAVGISAQFEGSYLSLNPGYQDTVWIVTGKKELGPLFQKQKLDFSLDACQTLIGTTPARLAGMRVGIEYRRVHRFGIGLYGLGDGVRMNSILELDTSITEAVLNLSYATFYYERVLFFNKRWEWSAAAHLGKGQISGSYRLKDDDQWRSFPAKEVKPFVLYTTGYYHLTWWCSLGAGVGYRFMRSTPQEVDNIFNAPIVIARVKIKLGKLVKGIWDENARNEY